MDDLSLNVYKATSTKEMRKKIQDRFYLKLYNNTWFYGFVLFVITIQFLTFKYLYPLPNFMPPDSYSYMNAASENSVISTWPIGYSRFLRIFSCFSKSHYLLVLFQYVFLQAAQFYFLLSFQRLVLKKKLIFKILALVLVLDPAIIHISNFVSSDSLFIALSFFWIAQLMEFLKGGSLRLVIGHTIVLYLVFIVRHSALYYPFFSLLVIVFSKLDLKVKRIAFLIVLLPILLFVYSQMKAYKDYAGIYQYSAFSGWQLAANALYGYSRSKLISINNVPKEFREIHKIVNNHIDSLKSLRLRPDSLVSIYYLWDEDSPLKKYMRRNEKIKSGHGRFIDWVGVAPLFKSYGTYLIISRPSEFATYFLYPNFKRFLSPPLNFMGFYALGDSIVPKSVVDWFGLASNRIYNRAGSERIRIVEFLVGLCTLANIFFLLSSIFFAFVNGVRGLFKEDNRIIGCIVLFWLFNLIFSVLSAPIELRYQLFPMIVSICYCVLIVVRLVGERKLQTIAENQFQ